MRIEKLTIVNAQNENETLVLGPIDGVKSAVITGDQSKSSWLKAISFALGYSNEMDSLSREFHDFNGFVEITFAILKPIFNDVDSSQMEKSLTIRRSIHGHQIDYSIDGSHAERISVKNLLQSYGFAKSYPFQYSIQCNDLTSIEVSNDKDRLQWLKNCCGVDEYCAKKDKSIRVLRETEDSIRKIDVSLAKIDVQLKIFASNEKQQIYQRWVSREKELGHFQRQYRIQIIRAEIEQINVKIKTYTDQIATTKNDVVQCASDGSEIRRENKSILEQINTLKNNEQQLQRDIVEYERTNMELVECISNLHHAIERGAMAEDLTKHEMRIYEEKIDQTRTRLSEIDIEIDVVDGNKEKIKQELDEFERHYSSIVVNCQQNQRLGTQFLSIFERNEYLTGLIKKTKNAISRENRKKNKATTELQPDIQKLENLKASAAKYNEQLTEILASNEECGSFDQQQQMMDTLENEQFELMEQGGKLAEKSEELKLNLKQVYDELRSQIGDSIFEGTKSMEALMQKSLAGAFRKQYFGLVIENFTCNEQNMSTSLATLMGEYLFYHIVDTPQTASRIISEFNEADLPGEVNFFALDDIIVNDDCDQYENTKRFCFDAKFQKVFEKIFDEMPSNVQELWGKPGEDDSIALPHPQVIEKNGALITINMVTTDASHTLDLYKKHQNLLELDEATRYEQSENSYRLNATICSLGETSKSLSKQHNTINSMQNIESRLAQTNHQIELCKSHIATKQVEIQKYDDKIKELTDTMNRYGSELKADFLLQEEKMAIERVEMLISDKNMERHQTNAEIEKLQAKRNNVSQFFDHTLMSRYSAIEESAKEHSNAMSELNRKEQEQLQCAENKRNAETNLNAVRRQLIDLQQQYESKKIILRDLDQSKSDLYQRQKSLYVSLNEIEIAKNNLTRELNQLFSIKPPDATKLQNPDIVDMSEADVRSQLDVARYQLKTFQNTNNFDLNILDKFKRDRESFVRRRAELAKIGAKITTAMETLDANISTSIEKTFDHLVEHFAAIFKRFVPNGSARMHLIKVTNSESDFNGDCGVPNDNTVVGIDIFARFQNEMEKPFNELLGQQRRIVSLAFIIGMQLLCPAPFYLFDCIDELFFEPYLTALITYLNVLSNETQIIITSNHQNILNGPNFIDNIFQSIITDATPKIQRIPYGEVALQQQISH